MMVLAEVCLYASIIVISVTACVFLSFPFLMWYWTRKAQKECDSLNKYYKENNMHIRATLYP